MHDGLVPTTDAAAAGGGAAGRRDAGSWPTARAVSRLPAPVRRTLTPARPLPHPPLPRRDPFPEPSSSSGDDGDDFAETAAQKAASNHLAIILSSSIVGVLLVLALLMSMFLCCRQRTLPPRYSVSTLATVERGARGIGGGEKECAWCYIADGQCMWCSGDARDDDDDDSPERPKLQVEIADLKHSGWRCVLNSPAAAPVRYPQRAGSPSVAGLERKRSFRPGGIYEIPAVPPMAVLWPTEDIEKLSFGG